MTPVISALILYSIAFLFGLVFGSFLNVVIHRVPRNQSIIAPRSQCPHCQTQISARDNIPLFSFLILFGKCRTCGEPINIRYPIVELLTGLVVVALLARFGLSYQLIPLVPFVFVLIVVSFIDIDFQLIPDRFTVSMTVFGLLGALLDTIIPNFHFWPTTFVNALLGTLVGFFVLFLFSYGYYWLTGVEGMGGGDLKMLAMVGAFLGWEKTLLTLFLACFIGSLLAMPLWLFAGKGRHTRITFGPFLALGAFFCLFYGDLFITMYLQMFNPPTTFSGF